MDERRKYVRLDTRLNINYTVLEKEQPTPFESETRDISGGGIRIFLTDPIPPQTLLKMTIDLPDEPVAISCIGKVVWSEELPVLQSEKKEKGKYEAGVMFTKIEGKDRDRIIKYVILGYAPNKNQV